MRPRSEPRFFFDSPQADEPRPIGIGKARPPRQDTTDVVLFNRRHFAESEIRGGRGPVDLGTPDVSLLDAHYAERLRAVRRDAEIHALFHEGTHERLAM